MLGKQDLLPIAMLALLISCGIEIGNPKQPTSGGSETENSAFLTEAVTSPYDETLSAISESYSDSSASNLNLTGGFSLAPINQQTCEESNGDVLVTFKREGEFSFPFTRKGRKFLQEQVDNITRTVTYTSPDEQLQCNARGNKLKPTWAKIDSLKATIKVNKISERSLTRINQNKIVRSGKVEVTGERQVQYQKMSLTDAGRIITQTITKKMVRKTSYLKQGVQTELKSTVANSENDPLVIENTIFAGQKTKVNIKSGTIVSNNEGEDTVTLTYKDLIFIPDQGCSPESGEVTGTFTNDSDEVVSQFTLYFTDERTYIKFADGVELDIEPDRCEFETQ